MKKLMMMLASVLLGGAAAAAAPSPTPPAPATLGVMALPFVAPTSSPASLERGVLVAEVVPASIAAAAGVAPGDVLTAIDGAPVTSADDVRAALAAKHDGDHVRLRVERARAARELDATVTAPHAAIAAPTTSWLAPLRPLLERVIPTAIAAAHAPRGVV